MSPHRRAVRGITGQMDEVNSKMSRNWLKSWSYCSCPLSLLRPQQNANARKTYFSLWWVGIVDSQSSPRSDEGGGRQAARPCRKGTVSEGSKRRINFPMTVGCGGFRSITVFNISSCQTNKSSMTGQTQGRDWGIGTVVWDLWLILIGQAES